MIDGTSDAGNKLMLLYKHNDALKGIIGFLIGISVLIVKFLDSLGKLYND